MEFARNQIAAARQMFCVECRCDSADSTCSTSSEFEFRLKDWQSILVIREATAPLNASTEAFPNQYLKNSIKSRSPNLRHF